MQLILAGDINLLGVNFANSPFISLKKTFSEADCVIANLEGCLFDRDYCSEGFYFDPRLGTVLKQGGFSVLGTANNKTYGLEPILESRRLLNELGILHAGSGANRAAARSGVVFTSKKGIRVGFLQRTSIYWANNMHEAFDKSAGVAVLKANTAYQTPFHYDDDKPSPPNRPGAPAKVITWVDEAELDTYTAEVAALKRECDILVSSHHWGREGHILSYQRQIARAAIDAGADVIMGHGTHEPLAIDVYKGKPILYSLAMLCFMRTKKRTYPDCIGALAKLNFDSRLKASLEFTFVRQTSLGEVYMSPVSAEAVALNHMISLSGDSGERYSVMGEWAKFRLD